MSPGLPGEGRGRKRGHRESRVLLEGILSETSKRAS